MSDSMALTLFLVPAMTLAVAYHPILAKLSVALVSPYPKADMTKRVFAAALDGGLIVTALVFAGLSQNLVLLFVAALYTLLRDATMGRSAGKFLFGLVVIDLTTGRPCEKRASINRNLLLLLPGANVVAVFLEGVTIARDPQGQRLGDRFASTQVVEGFGARDVVRAMQAWWLDFISQLERHSRKPGRVPVKRRTPVRYSDESEASSARA